MLTKQLLITVLLVGLSCAVNYANNAQLNSNFAIGWNIVSDTIQLKLTVNTTGWVTVFQHFFLPFFQIGFGIAEQTSGSMPGGDIVTVIVNDDKTVTIADRYATGKFMPQEDNCADWNLVSGTEKNGMTIVELTRLLNTNDSQDRPILVGLTKVTLLSRQILIFYF
jgi:hypothetical protein